ncbi:MAG: hypothetical protein QOF48_1561 [Verrucomicrobiota bacterium]|jgi:CHAD domain-containing protein
MAAGLRRQWKRYHRALDRCQAGCTEKAVHNSRVEGRRLEASLVLLKLFSPARPHKRGRQALEKHMACFDTLRDTQVQLRMLRGEARKISGIAPFRESLRRRESISLERALCDVRGIKTGRIKKLVRILEERLKRSAGDPDQQVRDHRAILRAVDAAQTRVAGRRRGLDPGHVATLHRARVAFKKLRYMMETLQPFFPAITRVRVESMHTLQTLFGQLQDTDTLLERLDKFSTKHPSHKTALASFRHWLLGRRATQIQRCMRKANALQSFWPPTPQRRARRALRQNSSTL